MAEFVRGVNCPRGHFNHPDVKQCARCGAETHGQPPSVRGARPSLGTLVLDDGTVFGLDRGYLLGIAPHTDPAVTGGLARPLKLLADGVVSPVHAEIRLVEWTVSVVDRGSTQGTFVLGRGDSTWTRLAPFTQVVIRAGTHIAVGQRVITFTSPWP
jgi:hypothetical protein